VGIALFYGAGYASCVEGIEIKQVEHGSALYELEVDLRRRVLREPLGLVFTKEQLDAECSDIHLVAIIGGKIVGCLVLTPTGNGSVQMRQVAVDPTMQGSGIGRELVVQSEAVALNHGYQEMMLHARDTAVGFYLKLGYEIRGEPFVEVAIPHREMFKVIRR